MQNSLTGLGNGRSYHLVTFGCQMNEHDSEVMAALLEGLGFIPVEETENADLIIINTCAVRKKPEDKVASMLGKLAPLKKIKKNMIIVVTGCMSQQEETAFYLKERFPFVNLIMGTHALPRLPLHVAEIMALGQQKTIVDIEEDYTAREGLPVKHGSSFKAWLPVNYGCNNFCSYCIVPYVRGRERSRKMEDIITEAESLVARGFLEITLLGQNVNSYGHDLPGRPTFAELLRQIDQIKGLARIRFMTSHPKDLPSELIKTIAVGEKICEHFHLPVQSGSNRILKLMRRQYSREKYLSLVQEIRKEIPGVALTTDLIVGFPGESEDDFNDTLSLLGEIRFDNAFSFLYSPRRNTKAATLVETMTRQEKEERLKQLNNLQHRISREINELLVGRNVELLVEGPSKNNPEMLTGRTRTNKLVHFPAPGNHTGKMIRVM
ncbi:MAG TPA: tRNA (N6-isopentenyl adenosine(37)-C2)-methylthiotransferase MiaB, partial [Firmicutes bacterium]|nr:tRNA (N6-isopentenyl adenosine(37)-C2)-methylthiotransferase MiaB [Bacillota bacterium]